MSSLNSTILDSIWLSGTNDYQQRIPNSTQGDIAQTVKALFDPMNGFLYNQFVDSLIMRIGNTKIHSNSWDNPLGNLKGDMLNYGNTIQEYAPNWIKAHSYADTRIDQDSDVYHYDSDYFASDLLNIYEPDGEAWYHSINRVVKYPISINDEEISRAFTDDYGLNKFINSTLQVPVNSDNYDEYRTMLQLTAEYYNRWGGYVDVLANDPETESGAKELLTKIRSYTGYLQFPTSRYNASVVKTPVFVKPEDLVVLINPAYEAYLDTQILSATFHVELADINVRRVIVDEFPIPNVVAMLVSKEWFVVHDKVYRTTSFYNPAELTTTYWLHHWQVCSCSPYMPCIYFMYGSGAATNIRTATLTVSGLSLSDIEGNSSDLSWSLGDGTEFNIVAMLTGSVSDDDNSVVQVKPDSVTFDISLLNDDNSDGKTYIVNSETKSFTDTAVYTVHLSDSVEAGDTLTINATSTYINPSGVTASFTDSIEFEITA